MFFCFTIYNQNIFCWRPPNFPDVIHQQSAGVSPCFTACLISPCHFISAGVYTTCLISFVPTGLPTSYLLPKNVLPLPHRGLAVLDGIGATLVVTSHAHYAVAKPYRFPLWHFDVLHGTDIHTASARSAFL